MLSSAGKFLTDAFEKLQSASDFLPSSSGGTVLNAAAANSKNSTPTALAVSSSAAGAGGLINTDSEAFHILKKAFGITAASAAVIGTAYYIGYQVARKRHRLHTRQADNNDQIESILGKFRLSSSSLHKVMELMLEEMFKGLDPETHHRADIKMFPTFVRQLPDGTERGDILALDLGGTNFRVLLVNLDSGEIKVKSKVFLIPQSIMIGTGVQLFDHIAKCVAEFMKAENLLTKSYPLGFTFSFPCTQNGLASASLVTWTKGFDCAGVVGKDVVRLLQDAIDKRGDIQIKVLALVNDTVGTLMASAYNDQSTKIGLILGTGSNACYVENLDNVKTWTGDRNEPKQVIINMEWGAFGDNGCLGFLLTEYDEEVDKTSLNPKKQIYEKMMSGMYMGEIVRLIILDLWQKELLFVGHRDHNWSTDYRQALYTKGSFYTKYVSEIETDSGVTFRHTKTVLEQLGLDRPTYDDCAIVQYVCKLVSRRAAQLAAAGLAVLLNHINEKNTTIAVDGSLYRFHPKFKKNMEKTMQYLTNAHIRYKIILSTDASGKGASLVAAVVQKQIDEEARAKAKAIN
jgi:hexokinase